MPQPFRFSVSLGGLSATELIATAKQAEELGYSAVTLPDHLDDQAAPLIGLTAAAIATKTLRVLPLVLANDYRHPAVLAKELASLDALSGGRLEFGLGAGWMLTDYEHTGIEHDTAGTRIARLAESVDIILSLLRGQDLDFEGQFYTVAGPLAPPLPVQAGGVPLMLAGGKQKMLTLAGAKADIVGINPGLSAGVIDERAGRNATAQKTDQKLDWVRDGAGPRFGELELHTRIHLAMITDDRDAVAAEMAPLLGISAEEAKASPHALVGTTTECIDQIKSWRERWGISYVSIDANVMNDFAAVVEGLAGT